MGCYIMLNNSLKSPVLSLKFCIPFHNISNYFKCDLLNYWTVFSNFSRKLMFKEHRSYFKKQYRQWFPHIRNVTKKPVYYMCWAGNESNTEKSPPESGNKTILWTSVRNIVDQSKSHQSDTGRWSPGQFKGDKAEGTDISTASANQKLMWRSSEWQRTSSIVHRKREPCSINTASAGMAPEGDGCMRQLACLACQEDLPKGREWLTVTYPIVNLNINTL